MIGSLLSSMIINGYMINDHDNYYYINDIIIMDDN